MPPLLIAYVCVGPLAWILLWIGTALARSRMDRLRKWTKALPEHPPAVTICIPAKDEGPAVRLCLESAFAQNYPTFDVVAIDDRSVDDTGKIFDETALENRRLRVVHVPKNGLPTGWLGKCHALHVGTRGLTSDWILFVDSDVTLAPDALSQAMSIALHRKYDAVSILTTLEARNGLERMMLPLLAGTWAVIFFVSLTNQDSRKDKAEANGQFFLIRRAAYEAVEGHSAVRAQITEDVELARLLKSNDFKVRLFMAPHLAATRMHATLSQMFHGWSRIYSGTARRRPWRILITMLAIPLCVDTVYPALAIGVYLALQFHQTPLIGAACLHWLLMTLFFRMIYRESGNSAWPALAAPYSTAILFAVFCFTLRKCWTGQILWRDTVFQQTH